jgi:glutamate racemase
MSDRAIGVFDSGVGGLTVARALLDRLPGESLVYLGDTARLPYGSKSADTVLRYSRLSAQFLLKQEIKLLVIACNTASAVAVEELSEELAVPVLGVVRPGAAEAVAATRNRHVGVLGTLGTVRSGAYVRAIAALDARVQVTPKACPLLVPLAEEGWTEGAIPEAVARRYLTELQAVAPSIDTLVLGCTHYPLFRPLLERVAADVFGHVVTLVDSAEAMARAVEAKLPSIGAATTPATFRCFVTDEARIDEIGGRFLGRTLEHVERADL